MSAVQRIKVDPNTDNPETVWAEYKRSGYRCETLSLPCAANTPPKEDHIRCVCISDTHSKLSEVIGRIPDGDILIHAGDFTNNGKAQEVQQFNRDLAKLPHRHKFVIAGNHEVGFHSEKHRNQNALSALGVLRPQDLLSNCHYLQDSGATVYGYRIWGSPWHPMGGWDFYLPRGEKLLEKWDQIPTETDILITHTPPLGHGDFANWRMYNGLLSGCVELLNTVEKRVKPLWHIFGHIHQMHGVTTNGTTNFVNASILDHNYWPRYEPIVFDIPLRNGFRKNKASDK